MKTYKFEQLSQTAKDKVIAYYQRWNGDGYEECSKMANLIADEMRRFIRRVTMGGCLPDFGGIYIKASLDKFDVTDVDYVLDHLSGWHPDSDSGNYEWELWDSLWEGLLEGEDAFNKAINEYSLNCDSDEAIVTVVNYALRHVENSMEGIAEREMEYVWGDEDYLSEYFCNKRFHEDGTFVKVHEIRK